MWPGNRVAAVSATEVSGPGDPQPAPDGLDTGPAGTRFGEIRRFTEIDSTNRYLLELARLRPLHGVVAVADHQTAGRGRQGRRWEAPKGANLLVSVLLVPDLPVEQLYLCTAAAGLATADACRRLAGLQPSLKWPNDLMVGRRKLAGILAESVPLQVGGGRAVVVGIGLNVGWPPPGAGGGEPDAVRTTATSILRETQIEVDKGRLLDALLIGLDRLLGVLGDEAGRAGLASEYRRRCATLGQHVVVTSAEGECSGVAVDVTAEGHLVVDVGARLRTISAGDVIHVRANG